MTCSNLLKSRSVLILCVAYFALPVVEWLVPSLRSTFVALDGFISIVVVGFTLVWFIGQVRNYPPNQYATGKSAPL
jgi:hypothetical protein